MHSANVLTALEAWCPHQQYRRLINQVIDSFIFLGIERLDVLQV